MPSGRAQTRMRMRRQVVLMATVVAASFLATASLWAESGSRPASITASTESGRKIYVNDQAPASSSSSTASAAPRSRLEYWSSTEHRWKPVPTSGAAIRAARSAASEVNSYLDGGSPLHLTRNRVFTQQEIDAAIDQAAARHNVDPNLVRSVIKVESNFNPNAVSRKGAMGLMQLMPGTARSLNVTNPFDPEQNVDAGVRHLKKLLESYGGDVRLSLAAYNAGSGAVAHSTGIPRYPETRNYVRRITNLYFGGGDPGSHLIGNPVHDPVRVGRDARGVLYITNTE
ncbi:MAG: lytic transglycosylase domain-containing protein [Terriglobales bacterium]